MLTALWCGSLAAGAILGWQGPLQSGGANPVAASMRAPTPQTSESSPAKPIGQGRTVTILGVGDILVHQEIIDQAKEDGGGKVDFEPQLEGIRPLVEAADIAICHIEFPMGTKDGPWTAWPDNPNSPPQLAKAVADLGFDSCSTASNHTLDQGFDGVVNTIKALDGAGVPHSGTAATPEEAKRINIIEANGVKVAHLAYTYGLGGVDPPNDFCCNVIDPTLIIADAEAARRIGADMVVVSLHAGDEGIATPNDFQKYVVQTLADSGQVNLVIGHHAHVVQPVTKVGNMWVAYGHGNLLDAQSRRDPRSEDGLLTMFTFTEQPDGTFLGTKAVGYAITNYDYPFRIFPVGPDGANDAQAKDTWARVKFQAIIPGDTSGFELVKF